MREGYLFPDVAAQPRGDRLALKFFHNVVPQHFLETARVFSISLPAVRSIHTAELLVLLNACAQQSQLNVEVARKVETFGSKPSSISQNLSHSLHDFVKFFQVLPEPSAYTLMALVNPKRTAAHLSSDRHVPCELQRRSDTRREVSPKTFSQQIQVHAFLLRSANWSLAVQES